VVVQAEQKRDTQSARSGMMVYINGKIVPAAEATVSVFDWGFLYGDGVFEGLPVVNGRCFKLHEHIERLLASARYALIPSRVTHDEWVAAVKATAQASNLRQGYMRPLVTRGTGMMGLRNIGQLGEPSALVIPQQEVPKTAEEVARMKVTARILSVRRTPPQCVESRAKLCNYQNNIMALLEQIQVGVDVGIQLDLSGFVAEAPAANIFVVHGDRVSTPRRHNVLNGITRATVIEIVAELGGEVVETDLTPFDLLSADEIFTTASLDGVVPVTEMNGRRVGNGAMGSMSRRLLDAYNSLQQRAGVDLELAEEPSAKTAVGERATG